MMQHSMAKQIFNRSSPKTMHTAPITHTHIQIAIGRKTFDVSSKTLVKCNDEIFVELARLSSSCRPLNVYRWPEVQKCTHLLLYFYEWQLTEKYLRSNKTCTLFLAPFEITWLWKYEAKYIQKQQRKRPLHGTNEQQDEEKKPNGNKRERERLKETGRTRIPIHEVIMQFHRTNNNIIIPNTFPTIQFYFNCFIVRLGSPARFFSFFNRHYYSSSYSSCFASLSFANGVCVCERVWCVFFGLFFSTESANNSWKKRKRRKKAVKWRPGIWIGFFVRNSHKSTKKCNQFHADA